MKVFLCLAPTWMDAETQYLEYFKKYQRNLESGARFLATFLLIQKLKITEYCYGPLKQKA